MPKLLRDYSWNISYFSNTDNTIADFYIPALESAIKYDRKSGFFSSAILSKVARGLGAMLHHQGQIRLIMGCQFSQQYLSAIQQGFALRDALLTRLDTELKPPENFSQLKHFEILSWLIANNYLDIKIAIPLKENGIPESSEQQLDPQHIFHEKVGIFTDSNGDNLAFSGSNNESISGWSKNVESFHVYCSWEGGRELDRVQEEISRFEQLWFDISPNVRVFDVPEAVKRKLLQYTPDVKPVWEPEIEFDTRIIDSVEDDNNQHYYFQRGGKPSSRLEQFLRKKDRILAYKIQDTWQRGKKIVNHKKILADKDFITASCQYLTANTPLKDLMFRHTRDTLRQYYQRGLLEKDIPIREVCDNAITLESQREIPLYQAVSDYVRHFYRLAQKDQRSCLGFLMTLYRKRLTSSFYAIKSSLQRRLDFLLTQQGNILTNDDIADLDDASDAVILGMESYLENIKEEVDPQEIAYLEDLLQQFDNTGEDTKLSEFIKILRQELLARESAIVFTQYTDTMDYLRATLQSSYGSQIACYSGRGGELLQIDRNNSNQQVWKVVAKEEIKKRFRNNEIKILLCTESASEGLNLQNCGVLINYDMPWNPMRVEQRIGRIDRIGQRYSTVRIHNFY